MSNKSPEDVLERSVFHKDEIFIKGNEETNKAYIIQSGLVRAFVIENGEEIDIAEYGPGIIVGEVSLMVDEPLRMNYQALEDTTVVMVSRHDFQKKLARADNTLKKIIGFLVNKLNHQDDTHIENATQDIEMDETALFLIDSLTSGLPSEKQELFRNAMLPDVDALVKTVKRLKSAERFEEERLAAAKTLAKSQPTGVVEH